MQVTIQRTPEEKAPEIFNCGNVVEYYEKSDPVCKEGKTFLILVTDDQEALNGLMFSGVIIADPDGLSRSEVGESSTGWSKTSFRQFKGKITLEV